MPGSAPSVRESQDLAQFDRTEATARLKMATAEVKEKQACCRTAQPAPSRPGAARGGPGAGRAGPSRSSIAAPSGPRSPAGWWTCRSVPGQYVLKGTTSSSWPIPRASSASCRSTAGASPSARPSRCRSRSRMSRARCRRSCRCPSRSRSCASWPRRSPPPGSSSPIPRASSSRAPRPGRPGVPVDADRHGPQARRPTRRPPRRRGLDGSGDPQRIRHQRAGARPGRHRARSRAGLRPVPAHGRADRGSSVPLFPARWCDSARGRRARDRGTSPNPATAVPRPASRTPGGACHDAAGRRRAQRPAHVDPGRGRPPARRRRPQAGGSAPVLTTARRSRVRVSA